MTPLVTSLAFAGLPQKIVTRTSPKAVMAFGMAFIGAGMLCPPHGSFWPDLAGPFFVAGIGTAFAFIPIFIGALTGVTERNADFASGLVNTSQNLGIAIGIAIGVAVASSIAASHFHTLIHHGCATAAALTGGFQLALWVCALTGLAAVPAAVPLIRRTERPNAVSIARAPEATMAMVGE